MIRLLTLSSGAAIIALLAALWDAREALGDAATKAVGGGPAGASAYPFQVALLKTDAYGEGAYPSDEPLRALACGGTLLGGPWVLTAAHCVAYRPYDSEFSDPQDFPPANCLPAATGDICVYREDALVVLAGTQELLPGKGQRLAIKRIIVEERYREAANEHDIALIELTEPAIALDGVLLATEAFAAYAQKDPGALARAVGWGLVDEIYGPNSVSLRQIDIPVQPLKDCRERHRLYEAWVNGTAWKDIDEDSMVTKNMICTGWDRPPPVRYGGEVLPNICFGDSGGFVGLKDGNERWTQIGIPSWLRDCETPYIYSVHTNVAAYRDWIALQTGLRLTAPALP